jgi:hypothetical protein
MWDELGIEPTRDAKAVRRAYAVRLRTIDPDRDPAAFQRLRAAYERALFHVAAEARRIAQQQAQPAEELPPPEAQPAAEPEPASPPAEPASLPTPTPPAPTSPTPAPPVPTSPASTPPAPTPPAPTPPPEDRERQEIVRAINTALQNRETLAALDLFDVAQARGLVRFGERDVALQGIMHAVIADRTIPAENYLAVMKRIGWDAVPTAYERGSEVRRAATARAEAEAWYMELAAWLLRPNRLQMSFNDPLARIAAWIKRRRERAYARLLLDGRWFLLSDTTAPALRAKLQLFEHYKGWIGQRFADADVARAQAMLRHEKAWLNLRTALFWTLWILFALLCLTNPAAFWIFWGSVFLARALTRRLRVALATARL